MENLTLKTIFWAYLFHTVYNAKLWSQKHQKKKVKYVLFAQLNIIVSVSQSFAAAFLLRIELPYLIINACLIKKQALFLSKCLMLILEGTGQT